MKACEKPLNLLNEHLTSSEFLGADHVTIADIQILFEIASFAGAHRIDLKDKYPNISNWIQRVSESHQIISRNLTDYKQAGAEFAASLMVTDASDYLNTDSNPKERILYHDYHIP